VQHVKAKPRAKCNSGPFWPEGQQNLMTNGTCAATRALPASCRSPSGRPTELRGWQETQTCTSCQELLRLPAVPRRLRGCTPWPGRDVTWERGPAKLWWQWNFWGTGGCDGTRWDSLLVSSCTETHQNSGKLTWSSSSGILAGPEHCLLVSKALKRQEHSQRSEETKRQAICLCLLTQPALQL
jgi:hypothetical protein